MLQSHIASAISLFIWKGTLGSVDICDVSDTTMAMTYRHCQLQIYTLIPTILFVVVSVPVKSNTWFISVQMGYPSTH